MGIVYILQSLTNSRYYIGSTNDLKRRMEEHNSGKFKYTRMIKPFKLVMKQEYPSLKEARQIENKIKRQKSRVLIEKIIIDQKIVISV